jgi:hypothetical protein
MFAICSWHPSQQSKSKIPTFGFFILKSLTQVLDPFIMEDRPILTDVKVLYLASAALPIAAFHIALKGQ